MSGNRRVVLRSRPDPAPSVENFAVESAPAPEPGPGEVLVKVSHLSVDPAMRGWIAAVRNYSEPVPIGGVMRGVGVGTVVESLDPGFVPGDAVYGWFGWQEMATAEAKAVRRLDLGFAPAPAYLGVLGMNGPTAWYGMTEICRPKPGDTVVVSTAAGAVGSAAGQIARLKGASRIVGITGSAEKARLCREVFGFDEVIDYRATPDLGAALSAACPEGIDVYYDNVGGATLDAVLARLRVGARIAICGTISVNFNAPTPPMGPRVERALLVSRARIEGFVIMDHEHRIPEAIAELGPWVRDGRLRYREDVVDGLERAPEALLRVLRGENLGKQLVRLVA